MTTVAGDSAKGLTIQTAQLVKSFNSEERQEILKCGNIPSAEISPEKMVALKANLAIPWGKLKTICR